MGLPKLPGVMAGQPGEHGRFLLPARADSPVMHRRIFTEGRPHLFPQSRREWETQKLPPKKKGGSSVLYSGLHGNSNPKGFPKLARSDGGTIPEERGRFFPRRGPASPVMHRRIFTEGRHSFILPNPEWDGNTKLPLLLQKVGVVFIKAKPTDKARGKRTEKGLGGASCTLPQPLRMRKLKVYAAACFPERHFRSRR